MRVSKRSLLPIASVLVFASICLFFYFGLGRNAREVPSALLGKEVPLFELPPLKDGERGLRTDDLKGQVMLVNIFASWCAPCRAEHPLLMRLAQEERILVAGIAWKDTRRNAAAFLEELGNPYYRIGFDGAGRVGIEWGVYGVPETYVIDREGRIRHKVVGPITAAELNTRLLPLINKLRQ